MVQLKEQIFEDKKDRLTASERFFDVLVEMVARTSRLA